MLGLFLSMSFFASGALVNSKGTFRSRANRKGTKANAVKLSAFRNQKLSLRRKAARTLPAIVAAQLGRASSLG
jgi:hypothetical protein